MKKTIIFCAIIYTALFAVLEAGVRGYEFFRQQDKDISKSTFNPASIFIPHPYSAYAANPDHPDHNSQGFRADKDIIYAADEETTTIACLGGSSTYGTRVGPEDSYPFQLEKQLSGMAGRSLNVINAGLGGYNTANIISLLSLRMTHIQPDILIFYVGFNDIFNRIHFSGFKEDYSHAQKSWSMPDFPFWRRSRLMDRIAEKLGSPSPVNPHIHMVAWHKDSGDRAENFSSSSAGPFRNNLITLISIARAHGAVPVFVTQASAFKNYPFKDINDLWISAMEEHTSVTREVAETMSVDLIDLRRTMKNRTEYFVDAIHMNEAGNRERARIIAEYLISKNLIK